MLESIENFIDATSKYQFLQNALIIGVVIGIIAGLVGSFSIMQGTSLIGDAMSHAVLPGIAVSYLLGIPLYLGAGFFGLLAAFLIFFIVDNAPIKTDTAIGIIFSSFLALGTIMLVADGMGNKLNDILFGNILVANTSDLIAVFIIGLIVVAFIFFFYHQLYLVVFDQNFAASRGINVKLYRQILILLLSLVIIAALQAVGVILVTAMLVIPPASSRLITKRFKPMIYLSMFFAVIASIIGLYVSYVFDFPSGPSIVIIDAIFFVFSFLIYIFKRLLIK